MEKEQTNKKNLVHKILIIPEVIIILFLFGVSIFTILSSQNKGLSAGPITGISLLPVKSDSMNPLFEQGDLVIGKKVSSDTEYEKGMVITYKWNNGYNTHRIWKIDSKGIWTIGDNPDYWNLSSTELEYVKSLDLNDPEQLAIYNTFKDLKCECVTKGNIQAIYQGRLKGVGNLFLFFTENQSNYFVFILLPLLLLFLWNIYSFMKVLFENKKEKILKAAAENVELTEEMKQKAIQEYLAQQAQTSALENKDAEVTTEEKKEVEEPADEQK